MGEAKLGRCPRCKGYALVAERQGLRVAVDIAPVDALGFGVAVAGGVELYWAQNEPGRPARVLGRRSARENPSWGVNGSQTGSQRLHAEHSCGAPARDIVLVPVSRPQQPSATSGRSEAGSRPLAAPAGGTRALGRPSPVRHATRRPSRCSVCDRMIKPGELYVAIDHPQCHWAVHEECP
jgi:hypothetical protein